MTRRRNPAIIFITLATAAGIVAAAIHFGPGNTAIAIATIGAAAAWSRSS